MNSEEDYKKANLRKLSLILVLAVPTVVWLFGFLLLFQGSLLFQTTGLVVLGIGVGIPLGYVLLNWIQGKLRPPDTPKTEKSDTQDSPDLTYIDGEEEEELEETVSKEEEKDSLWN